MRLEPGQTVDGYTIMRRVGHGGMGVVYQAHAVGGRPVVLKVPFDSLLEDPGTRARYAREMEIARALDHPHIQHLIATGETGSVPYAVLEWIDGSLLREHLYTGQPLQIDEAVDLAVQLCDALEYCHERGIIHRDLKPDNVMVTRDGQVKLLDFGAALLQGGRRITTASLSPALGTPDYMSPEQVEGQRGDARTDVYSLGAMLYELLSGAPPYQGDNALAVMAQHVRSRPVPLRQRNRKVSPALEAVVAKTLRRDPARRYQTVADLNQDLLHLDQVDLQALAAEERDDRAAGGAGGGRQHALWRRARMALPALVLAAIIAGLLIGVLAARLASP